MQFVKLALTYLEFFVYLKCSHKNYYTRLAFCSTNSTITALYLVNVYIYDPNWIK